MTLFPGGGPMSEYADRQRHGDGTTAPPTPARSGAQVDAACDGRPSAAATGTREPSRRPPPSTVRRYVRRPEFVEAVQSTLPVGVSIDSARVEPGDWILMRGGEPLAVLGDAEFRALYVEDDEATPAHTPERTPIADPPRRQGA